MAEQLKLEMSAGWKLHRGADESLVLTSPTGEYCSSGCGVVKVGCRVVEGDEKAGVLSRFREAYKIIDAADAADDRRQLEAALTSKPDPMDAVYTRWTKATNDHNGNF